MACKEPQAARATLEQALELAAQAEIVRPFVDLGQAMAVLLREAAKGGPQADFATTVLAAFPDGGDPGAARSSLVLPAKQTPVEPLTDRELEVLTLLSERLSYKEIAAILVLAPATVKKAHTQCVRQTSSHGGPSPGPRTQAPQAAAIDPIVPIGNHEILRDCLRRGDFIPLPRSRCARARELTDFVG